MTFNEMMIFSLAFFSLIIGILFGAAAGLIKNSKASAVVMFITCAAVVGLGWHFASVLSLDDTYRARWAFMEAVMCIGIVFGGYACRNR